MKGEFVAVKRKKKQTKKNTRGVSFFLFFPENKVL